MPTYTYTAKSFEGQEEKGLMAAKSKSQLARSLKERGLVLISAQEKGEKAGRKKKGLFSLFGVSVTDKLMFVRNLRVMISAGISLPRALELLANQAKSKRFSQALLYVRDEIVKGRSFSEALSDRSDIFSELFSSMVKVGEASGKLEEVLELSAKQTANQHELASKIKGALIYPIVIIVAMSGIGIAMLTMVVPKIAETFKELDIELPATTKFVIWLGESLASKWYLLILGALLAPIVVWRLLKTKAGRKISSFLTLRIPLISSIIKKASSARTARTLSSLIAAGVPITRSLEIIAKTMSNVYYQKAMMVAAEGVRKGKKLSETLTPYTNIYSSLVIQMIAVGEETGQTGEILEKLASFYEEEVANVTKNLASIIEPIVMLFIGAAVGFFAIAMLQPMYAMLGAIQ